MVRTFIVIGATLLGFGVAPFGRQKDSDYRATIAKWRIQQEADLKTDDGWLCVTGLQWLQDGASYFGQNAEGHIVWQSEAGTETVGEFVRSVRTVTVKALGDSPVMLDGKKFDSAEIGGGDKVTMGAVTMAVISRRDRLGIRVWDTKSFAREHFTGRKWFAVDPRYRIDAKFIPYDPPKSMPITNVIGDTTMVPNPGYVEFILNGKKCRLEAQDEGGGFFFNFRDATSGKSTFPAGRFLDAPKPINGYVLLDFNQATNPPCAFTEFATCPLPPAGNTLEVAIKAGEKAYRPVTPGKK